MMANGRHFKKFLAISQHPIVRLSSEILQREAEYHGDRCHMTW